MPRFFFHVHDGKDQIDEEGTELPGIEAARTQALELAGEIIRDAGRRAELSEEWRIEVTDITGLVLFIMDFVVSETAATGRRRRP